MKKGLFDTPAKATKRDSENDEDHAYKALAGTSIAAATLAFLSPLAFIDWWLLAVPTVGFCLGLVALRDIIKRPDIFTGKRLATTATIFSLVCLVGGTIYLSWVYAAELPEGFERVHYGILQPAEGSPASSIPDSARALNGHNVLIKGYMYPGKKQFGIRQFLLVRDQGDCCFGGNPKITDRVLVHLQDEKGMSFSSRQKKLAGTFTVRPTFGQDGIEGGVIYHLEEAFPR